MRPHPQDAPQALLAGLCESGALHGTHAARPQRWHRLAARRGQPLLVPVDAPRFAAAAIRFFIGTRPRQWLAQARLAWADHARQVLELPGFPVAALFNQPGQVAPRDLRLALCCGSPGPLRKLVVLAAPAGSDPEAPHARDALRVAKIAMAASADRAIEHEAHWLRLLGRQAATARFVPRLYNEGRLGNGRRFVVMSALPRGRASHAFGTCHGDFLAALGRPGRTLGPWPCSEAYCRLRARCAALAGLVEPEALRPLREALDAIERGLARTALPTCIAHGDFAPWNMRLAAGQLFVFDWEYAQADANPLHDYLHFHVMTRIAAGRALRAAWLRDLLAGAGRHGAAVFGATVAPALAKAAPLLLAQYLVDTISFYAQQSGYLDARHPVLRPQLRLLAARRHWCAEAA